ncbi:MAG: ParD-like family protein [Actinobacteria bacterium]|jgi:hypothetical protein|nr:ParD-like family protein [Actinomycetota bacterium]
MSMPVRIEPDLYNRAKKEAAVEHRTIAGQIEFWAQVGRACIDNPDLPVNFVIDSLASLETSEKDKKSFKRREI